VDRPASSLEWAKLLVTHSSRGRGDCKNCGIDPRADGSLRTATDRPAQPGPLQQAKGALAAHTKLDVNQPFYKMRAHARSNNLNLTDVATAIIDQTVSSDIVITA